MKIAVDELITVLRSAGHDLQLDEAGELIIKHATGKNSKRLPDGILQAIEREKDCVLAVLEAERNQPPLCACCGRPKYWWKGSLDTLDEEYQPVTICGDCVTPIYIENARELAEECEGETEEDGHF